MQTAESKAGSKEGNMALIRRFYEAFEANDQISLDQILAADLAVQAHSSPAPIGRDAHVQGIDAWNAAFSETRFTIEDQFADGEMVATRVAMHARHDRGAFLGVPPTGRPIAIKAITIERVRNGQITERHVMIDQLAMMQQLGIVPTSA